MDVVFQADGFQHVVAAERVRGDLLHQRDVLDHGQGRDQVVALEHKPDGRRAVFGQFVGRQGGNILSVDDDRPFRRAVQASEHVQQRTFSGAAGPEDHDEFSFLQAQVHMIQRVLLMVPVPVNS